jgi:glycosyltransferase involved in cell wall biosynthesis
MGLPNYVPVVVNYLPVFGPDNASPEGMKLPWRNNDAFVVGFAGALTEQKGWKVLLAAVERLLERFKVVLVGDGELRAELESWVDRPGLKGRVHHIGLLPKEKLLATYPQMDVLVLPSITTAHSVEQFGCVLAEAMACGVPVIGSDSGAIPEIIGEAGLIFPESDGEGLAQAILQMSQDEELRHRCAAWGRERYHTHYGCEAYARSIAALLKITESRPPDIA